MLGTSLSVSLSETGKQLENPITTITLIITIITIIITIILRHLSYSASHQNAQIKWFWFNKTRNVCVCFLQCMDLVTGDGLKIKGVIYLCLKNYHHHLSLRKREKTRRTKMCIGGLSVQTPVFWMHQTEDHSSQENRLCTQQWTVEEQFLRSRGGASEPGTMVPAKAKRWEANLDSVWKYMQNARDPYQLKIIIIKNSTQGLGTWPSGKVLAMPHKNLN